jgi:hypothetical protein
MRPVGILLTKLKAAADDHFENEMISDSRRGDANPEIKLAF